MARRAIVDAHHHLWDLNGNSYGWLDGPPFAPSVAGDVGPIAKSYVLADYRNDAASYELKKSVHVDAGCDDPLAEASWLQRLADAEGLPTAIVASAKLHEPGFEAQLERYAALPAMRGVRHILNWDPDPALTYTDQPDLISNPDWLRGFKLLNRFGFSFDLQIYPWQLGAAADLAAAHPDTLIILNHAGMPLHQRGTGLETWRHGMRALARNENAVAKISGLGMVNWTWTEDEIRPIILETVNAFGVDRCMFGSNFPVDKLYSSFDALYEAFEAAIVSFSEHEKEKMFVSNAERFYRL